MFGNLSFGLMCARWNNCMVKSPYPFNLGTEKNKLPLKDTVCAIHLGLRRASTGNANAVKYKRSVIDQIQIVQRGSHQIC